MSKSGTGTFNSEVLIGSDRANRTDTSMAERLVRVADIATMAMETTDRAAINRVDMSGLSDELRKSIGNAVKSLEDINKVARIVVLLTLKDAADLQLAQSFEALEMAHAAYNTKGGGKRRRALEIPDE